MKKRTVLLILALFIVAIACSAFLMRKKITRVLAGGGKSKNVYAHIKLESTTMPGIYHEMVNKSDPFSLYGRNDEILPILQKRYEQDPGNVQLKFALGLQHIYFGTTQEGIDLLESLEKDPKFMDNADFQKPNDKG